MPIGAGNETNRLRTRVRTVDGGGGGGLDGDWPGPPELSRTIGTREVSNPFPSLESWDGLVATAQKEAKRAKTRQATAFIRERSGPFPCKKQRDFRGRAGA